ncbi:MAG: nickel transporter [Betaproteobacteria bacterium RIFCSPLOWO2_02_FULL_63_19]|nr:MAG: nickel transporter [Betaproteobacteria bacterium RIFCSPLOWO2_02_FULL_63_19]
MESLPQNLIALCLVVFAFGIKHGFDADHLAAIDGLTRFNACANPRLARFCGALFSLGHGTVVILVAIVVSLLTVRAGAPQWLQAFGAWASIAFLTALGLLNIHAVLRAHPGHVVRPQGIKGRFLGGLTRAASPGLVALVGALFAISFDTLSQAALFALTAAHFGGWQHALTIGLVFTLGMLLTDGINGLWISRLIRRADQTARVASRVMSLVVGGVSLLVAAFGAARIFVPAVDVWSEGRELVFGAGVVVVIAASYVLALRLAAASIDTAAAAEQP